MKFCGNLNNGKFQYSIRLYSTHEFIQFRYIFVYNNFPCKKVKIFQIKLNSPSPHAWPLSSSPNILTCVLPWLSEERRSLPDPSPNTQCYRGLVTPLPPSLTLLTPPSFHWITVPKLCPEGHLCLKHSKGRACA